MDFGFCGIIDIILCIIFIITIIVGYKKGFISKALSLLGFFLALILAISFCDDLGLFFKNQSIIYPSIYEPIYNNILESGIIQNGTTSLEEVFISLEVPKFIAGILASLIGDKVSVTNLATSTAESLALFITNVAAFFIIIVGVLLISLILKLLSKILRTNSVFRFIDGVFGVILYSIITLCFVYFIFTLMRFFMDQSWFVDVKNFLIIDMKLAESDVFRISKYFYEHNFIYNLIALIK